MSKPSRTPIIDVYTIFSCEIIQALYGDEIKETTKTATVVWYKYFAAPNRSPGMLRKPLNRKGEITSKVITRANAINRCIKKLVLN